MHFNVIEMGDKVQVAMKNGSELKHWMLTPPPQITLSDVLIH